jgi:hypothetical protein
VLHVETDVRAADRSERFKLSGETIVAADEGDSEGLILLEPPGRNIDWDHPAVVRADSQFGQLVKLGDQQIKQLRRLYESGDLPIRTVHIDWRDESRPRASLL